MDRMDLFVSVRGINFEEINKERKNRVEHARKIQNKWFYSSRYKLNVSEIHTSELKKDGNLEIDIKDKIYLIKHSGSDFFEIKN